jgi:transposase-like protein
MVSARTRPPYPESFRREPVALVRREGRSIRDVADSLGVEDVPFAVELRDGGPVSE